MTSNFLTRNKTSRFGNMNQTNQSTNASPFSIKTDGIDLMLTAPNKKYKSEECTTISNLYTFYERFKTVTNDMELFKDFDWTGCLLGGGLIHGLMEAKFDKEEYEHSDFDIFVYSTIKGNPDEENKNVINKMKEIYTYFSNKFTSVHGTKLSIDFIYDYSYVITILPFPFKTTQIQIIGTNKSNPIDVLKAFDMTHCQVGFNGEIICTNEYIKAMKNMVTKITKHSIHAYRIVKAYNRGFSIAMPEKEIYIKNYFGIDGYKQDDKTKMLTRTDKHWDYKKMEEQIKELIDNDIVKKNLSKNYFPDHELCASDMINRTSKYMDFYKQIMTQFDDKTFEIIDLDEDNETILDDYLNEKKRFLNVFK